MSQIIRDQMGHSLSFAHLPGRIISLVPSQTELLADLGLSDEVIGITKFCVHPRSWYESKTKVGGTKQFNFEAIDRLAPDLILGNKEENYREGIERLQSNYPVWMSDILNLDDALTMIRSVATLVGREQKGNEIIDSIQKGFDNLIQRPAKSVLYLIWKKPWMAAGTGTFIHDLLSRLNLKNVVSEERYPELLPERISVLKPDLIFLSSEPYPFKEEHISDLQQLCPAAKVMLVDGEIFSWYGSRLMQAPAYFNSLPIT